MSLSIIRATVENAKDISYVHAMSWQSAYAGIVPQDYLDEFTPENRAELAKKVMPTRPEEYYISYFNGLPIGMFILGKSLEENVKPNTGEIFALYLLPDYWGKGFGKSLMHYAVERLHELLYCDVVLWVLVDNMRARSFYEKYGYVFNGIKKEIFIGGKLLMEIQYILEFSK